MPTDEARLTKCTTICTGSPDTIPFEACGGPGTVAIYDIPVPKDTPQPPLTIDGHDGPSDFLGCFKLDSNTENNKVVVPSGTRRELTVDDELGEDPLALSGLTGTMTNKVNSACVLCVRFPTTKSTAYATSGLCGTYTDSALFVHHPAFPCSTSRVVELIDSGRSWKETKVYLTLA